MTSIIVLVPDTGQVLLQKNLGCSTIPSVTYLPMGASFSYGQRYDVRLEKFRAEHHMINFLPVSQFIMIVSIQKNDVQYEEEDNFYFGCLMHDFAAGMVLLKGRNELDASAFTSCDINLHTNRLQRDFQMFSHFFDNLSKSIATPSVLLNTTEFMLSENRKEFSELLENFTESCECVHACIIVGGKILCGTSEWFKQIKIAEMRLIVSFVVSMHEQLSSSISDIPIFLPYTNPNSPVRLLKVQLMQDALLIMLCANDVKIQTVISQIDSILSSRIDLFQSALHIKERSFPLQSQPNAHVQAFCCFSRKSRLSILSFNPHVNLPGSETKPRNLDKETMRTYLCDFIKTNFEVIKMIDSQPISASDISGIHNQKDAAMANKEAASTEEGTDEFGNKKEVESLADSSSQDSMSELLWVKKSCKVYLLGSSHYIMIALFSSDTPTYPMGSITTTLLETVTSSSDF